MTKTQAAAFEKWWEKEGRYLRAGGGDYEKTFAYHAYESALEAMNGKIDGTLIDLAIANSETRLVGERMRKAEERAYNAETLAASFQEFLVGQRLTALYQEFLKHKEVTEWPTHLGSPFR